MATPPRVVEAIVSSTSPPSTPWQERDDAPATREQPKTYRQKLRAAAELGAGGATQVETGLV
jgi:hypothetical protein